MNILRFLHGLKRNQHSYGSTSFDQGREFPNDRTFPLSLRLFLTLTFNIHYTIDSQILFSNPIIINIVQVFLRTKIIGPSRSYMK